MKCIILDTTSEGKDLVSFIDEIPFLDVHKICSDFIQLIYVLGETDIDLIFVDTQVLNVAPELFFQCIRPYAQIIVHSSDTRHCVNAYDHDVTDYLIKPCSWNRFKNAVYKARHLDERNWYSSSYEDLFIKRGKRIIKIQTGDVLWIEGKKDHAVIRTKDNKYISRTTLRELERRLPETSFMRIHRSFIVHLDKISSLDDHTITINNHHIPIGKTNHKTIKKRMRLVV